MKINLKIVFLLGFPVLKWSVKREKVSFKKLFKYRKFALYRTSNEEKLL